MILKLQKQPSLALRRHERNVGEQTPQGHDLIRQAADLVRVNQPCSPKQVHLRAQHCVSVEELLLVIVDGRRSLREITCAQALHLLKVQERPNRAFAQSDFLDDAVQVGVAFRFAEVVDVILKQEHLREDLVGDVAVALKVHGGNERQGVEV
jgi:hypothetical protein